MTDAQEQTGLPKEPSLVHYYRVAVGYEDAQTIIAYADALRSFAEGLVERINTLEQAGATLLMANAGNKQRAESAEAALALARQDAERLRSENKDLRESVRDAAAEERWKHKQGDEYGSY